MSTGNTGTISTHFNFTLPGYDDDTDIDDLNTNFNIIDTSLYDAVQDIATNVSDISSLRDSVSWIRRDDTVANFRVRYHPSQKKLSLEINSLYTLDIKESGLELWHTGGSRIWTK